MIIAAVELLDKNPNPTVVQIKDAFTNKPPPRISAAAARMRPSSMPCSCCENHECLMAML